MPRHLLLVAVGLGTLLTPLNSSMIAVALVRMKDDFGLSFHDVTWLVSIFYLVSAVAQPLMGKLADLWGRKRLFVIGLAVVGVASVGAASSPTFELVVACRAVQALGSSALFPCGMGIVRHHVHRRQAHALGVLSVFSSISAGAGPALGGFLLAVGDWPAVFLVNVPLIAVDLVLAVRVLPADSVRPDPRGSGRVLAALDPRGVAVFATTITALLLFLVSLDGSDPRWWAAVVAVAGAVLLLRLEQRSAAPFIDTRALVRSRLLSVYGSFVLVNVVFYAIFFTVPSYLQEASGFGSAETGLLVLTLSGLGVVTVPLAARLIERLGSRAVIVSGAAVMTAGALLLTTLDVCSSVGWIVVVLCVIGVSTGFNNLGLQSALNERATAGTISAASGLFMTSRYLGTILASTLVAVTFAHTIGTRELHRVALVLGAVAGAVLAGALAGAARRQ